MVWLILLFTLLFYSIWRRVFGSDKLITNKRSVKCIAFLIVTFYACWLISNNIQQSIIFSGLGYLLFCLANGPAFDCGRDGKPDEDMIKRYNKGIYHYLPDLIIPKEHRYGYVYDLIWMEVRYVLPVIAIICLPIVNISFLHVGILIPVVYAMCWTIEKYDHWLLEKIPYTNAKPTAFAEYICGGLFGLFPLFIGG